MVAATNRERIARQHYLFLEKSNSEIQSSPVLLKTESVPCIDRERVAAPLMSLCPLCYIATILHVKHVNSDLFS